MGTWYRLCGSTKQRTPLAVFSANGFTSLHPSIEEGKSYSNFLSNALNLTSVVRIRPECSGTVVCTVGHEEDEARVDRGRSVYDEYATVLKERGRGLAFRCAPVHTCVNYSVEWFLDDTLLLSGSLYVNNIGNDVLNSDLMLWLYDELWIDNVGPWSRSPSSCLSCRVRACGNEEIIELCGAEQAPERGVSPTFSFFWYVIYALFIVYMTR